MTFPRTFLPGIEPAMRPGFQAADGLPPWSAMRRIAFVGDSITEAFSNTYGYLQNGYGAYALGMSGHRLSPVQNPANNQWDFGYSGQSAAQMIAAGRPAEILAATNEHDVIFCEFTNDLASGVIEFWDLLRAGGRRVIGSELTYMIDAVVTDEAQLAANALLKAGAAARRMPFVEWYSALKPADPGLYYDWYKTVPPAANPEAFAYTSVHPADSGASRLGAVLAATIKQLIPAAPPVPAFFTSNWEMSGTAPNSPTGWSVYASQGTISNKRWVPAADGGNPWFEATLTHTTGTYAKISCDRNYTTGFSAADVVRHSIELELETVSGTGATCVDLQTYRNGVYAFITLDGRSSDDFTRLAEINRPIATFSNARFVSPAYTVPAGTTAIRPYTDIYIAPASVIKVRYRNAGLYKV